MVITRSGQAAGRFHAISQMNVSGADPLGTIRLYGNDVLPALRG